MSKSPEQYFQDQVFAGSGQIDGNNFTETELAFMRKYMGLDALNTLRKIGIETTEMKSSAASPESIFIPESVVVPESVFEAMPGAALQGQEEDLLTSEATVVDSHQTSLPQSDVNKVEAETSSILSGLNVPELSDFTPASMDYQPELLDHFPDELPDLESYANISGVDEVSAQDILSEAASAATEMVLPVDRFEAESTGSALASPMEIWQKEQEEGKKVRRRFFKVNALDMQPELEQKSFVDFNTASATSFISEQNGEGAALNVNEAKVPEQTVLPEPIMPALESHAAEPDTVALITPVQETVVPKLSSSSTQPVLEAQHEPVALPEPDLATVANDMEQTLDENIGAAEKTGHDSGVAKAEEYKINVDKELKADAESAEKDTFVGMPEISSDQPVKAKGPAPRIPSLQEEAEFEKSFEEQMREEEELQMVGFFLGQQEFTVPTMIVQEVIRYCEPAKLPSAPSYVAGVINLRGKVTPLIRLRDMLDIKHDRKTEDSFIIVCRKHGLQIGLVIERVHTIYRVSQENIDWGIEGHLGINIDFVSGLLMLNDTLVGIVSVDRILEHVLNEIQA